MEKVKIIVMMLVLLVSNVYAAEHYIREGASGDGSDWANAWTELPSTLQRGDTYYIADGEYPGHTFDDAESETQYITIKKAIESDHGTNTGWQSSYGDGVVDFTSEVRFDTNFWIFDGQSGYGDSSREQHGFRFMQTNCGVRSYGLIRLTAAVDHIRISHVEIEQCGEGVPGNVEPRFDGIQSLFDSHDIIFSHLYIHDFNRVAMLIHNIQDSVVEHCFFEHRLSANYEPDRTIHGGGIVFQNSHDVTFRYNIFKDIRGTAGIEPKDSVQSHMYMYGNIFYNTDPTYSYSNGAISNTGGDTNTYMHVYNNLFVDLDGSGSAVGWFCGGAWCSGTNQETNVAYNNIVYNSINGASHTIGFMGSSHDYNMYDDTHGEAHGQHWTGGSSLFVDYMNDDFHLAVPTQPGTTLSYNEDPDGNTRGADGNWDRGAYEFVESSSNQHYVRADATGSNDGSSWNNAWNELDQINWGDVEAGDVIEIAGGTYSTNLVMSASGVPGQEVTIKRTDNPLYNSQVNIHNFIDITGSHIVFDGTVDNGIKIMIPNTGGYIDGHYIDTSGSDITIKNIEIEGPGYRTAHLARGIQPVSDNILFDNVNIHDFSAVAIRLNGGNGVTIQNSRLHNIASPGDAVCQAERGVNCHSEHIAVFGGVSDFELKNSIISQDYDGDLASGFGMSFAQLSGGYIRVHDNKFFNVGYPVYVNSDGLGPVSEYVVNGNTFVGYRVPISSVGTPTQAVNNIFCNLESYFTQPVTRSAYSGGSHNLYCDDDRYRDSYIAATNSQVLSPGEHPFVDYFSDWHLAYATDPGIILSQPYVNDYEENSRGSDGLWDRGAYEFLSNGCTPTLSQLIVIVDQWRQGIITMAQLMDAIQDWKECG